MGKSIFRALEDLCTLLFKTKTPRYVYAFLVHPRGLEDVYVKYPFLKVLPRFLVHFILRHLWPVRVAPIRGLVNQEGVPVHGVVIACPGTARQLMQDREYARRIIIRAAKLAKQYGATAVGLGALTASLSRGGLDVKEAVNLTVVNGRLYTVYNVCSLAERAVEALGSNLRQASVGIVGAAGSIGGGCAQYLAAQGVRSFTLVDMAQKRPFLEDVRNLIRNIVPDAKVSITDDLMSLRASDVIVTATSHPDALLRREHVQPGTVIVDDAQPTDVERALFTDPEVLVLEGGAVHSTHIHIPFDFGLKHQNDIFSCLAELLLVVHQGALIQPILGRMTEADLAMVRSMARAGEQLGFSTATFQNMYRVYTEEDLCVLRTARDNRQ